MLHFVACAGFKRELQTQNLIDVAQALIEAGADPLAASAEGLAPVDLIRDKTGALGVFLIECTEQAARRKRRVERVRGTAIHALHRPAALLALGSSCCAPPLRC